MSEDKPGPRCDVTGHDEPTFCQAMDGRLATITNAHRKGLTCIHTTHRQTGEVRFLGVAYKQTPHDRGLMLNWCPFCGVDLTTRLSRMEQSKESNR